MPELVPLTACRPACRLASLTMDDTSGPTDERTLSPAEAELSVIANRTAGDGFLGDLLFLADADAGFPVGLLLNGMVVSGQLAPRRAFAEEIDTQRRNMVARLPTPDGQTDEEWAETVETFSTQATRATDDYLAELEQLDKDIEAYGGRGGVEVRKLPAELGRRVIAADAWSYLTLRQVKISAPGQVGVTQVAVMRVAIAQIAGWWVLATDEEGNSRLALWETNVPGVSRDS